MEACVPGFSATVSTPGIEGGVADAVPEAVAEGPAVTLPGGGVALAVAPADGVRWTAAGVSSLVSRNSHATPTATRAMTATNDRTMSAAGRLLMSSLTYRERRWFRDGRAKGGAGAPPSRLSLSGHSAPGTAQWSFAWSAVPVAPSTSIGVVKPEIEFETARLPSAWGVPGPATT